jgi:hypothetical protein
MRRELSVKAEEVRSELNARARESEWMPIFQRDERTNGTVADTFPDRSGSVQEAAAETGTLPTETADEVAAEPFGTDESSETLDRETQS